MSFGEDYSRAYDAFYRTKDYPGEARFVGDRLTSILGDRPLSILDIGCGTGLHDIELAGAGHSVVGADMSAGMLARAEERRAALPAALQGRLRFVAGDARGLRLGQTFDAVISLFHVMSYMTGDGDFDAALATARSHLNPGGAFLFDFWYGPAVLADPPTPRERVVEEAGKRIRRSTRPDWDKARDAVRVAFDVEETDLVTAKSTTTSEEHVMRYFFEDGLRASLPSAGFEILEIGEWLTGARPRSDTFGVYALTKAS